MASGFLYGDDAAEFMRQRGVQTWEAANEAGGCAAEWWDECARCEHAKLVSKRYFKTQREIQSAYDISRSCIYHTMHHNLERIKKYLSCD